MSDLSPADREETSLGHLNLGQDTSDDVGLELPVIEMNKNQLDSGHGNEDQNAEDWWNHVQTVVINEENANCPADINRKNSTGYAIYLIYSGKRLVYQQQIECLRIKIRKEICGANFIPCNSISGRFMEEAASREGGCDRASAKKYTLGCCRLIRD